MSTRPAGPGPNCLTALGLGPQCGSREPPFSTCGSEVEVRKGSYLTERDGIKLFFSCSNQPWSHKGFA